VRARAARWSQNRPLRRSCDALDRDDRQVLPAAMKTDFQWVDPTSGTVGDYLPSYSWYDCLGRTVAAANYGREDVGSAWFHSFFHTAGGTDAGGTYNAGDLIDVGRNGIPDVAEDEPPEPYQSNTPDAIDDAYIVSLYEYNDAGRLYRTIDNIGRINETQYDDAGRTVRTIQNYDDGTVEETDTTCDVTVAYQYDSAGRLVTMTAYNAKGDDNDPYHENFELQQTKYLYESEINASWQTAVVYGDSTDVLSQDSTTKIWTITTDNGDHTSTTYDRLGRTQTATDQRGVEHTYVYDTAGRITADCVTDLGSSAIVDDAILAIVTTYDDIGRVQTVTSYDSATARLTTDIVNQVEYQYDSWGNLYREYQEHDGAVDSNTLFTEYDYSDGASGGIAKYVRLTDVIYPDSRDIHYSYSTTGEIDDVLSRLHAIDSDLGSTLPAVFEYLGRDTIAKVWYSSNLTTFTCDNVASWDRFGRVVDQVWESYNDMLVPPTQTIDEYLYAYDRAGNRTSRQNVLDAAFSELYEYDNLDRLTSTTRADDFDQSWSLDGAGNFSGFDDDGNSQTRTVDAANQIQSISGGGWVTPEYDAAGNMISGPKSGDPTTRLHYVYDAWNRLVGVYADDSGEPGDLIAQYEYDGGKRRIEKTFADETGVEYYYNNQWQLVEERFVDDEGLTTAVNQYVWSPRYIDAPMFRLHDGNADGDIGGEADNVHLYLTDANYNVTAVLDWSGSVVERYVYDAYGKATAYDDDWDLVGAPAEDGPMYCGYFFDAETANYLARNRYYSTSLSTWLSRDPIGYLADDPNLYQYCGNNPLTRVDPLGTDWAECILERAYCKNKNQSTSKLICYWRCRCPSDPPLQLDPHKQNYQPGVEEADEYHKHPCEADWHDQEECKKLGAPIKRGDCSHKGGSKPSNRPQLQQQSVSHTSMCDGEDAYGSMQI
jgi:RHS repeat-associated protein